MKLFYYYFIL